MYFMLLTRTTSFMTIANFSSRVSEVMSYGVLPIANKVMDLHNFIKNGVNSMFIDGDNLDVSYSICQKSIEF